MIWNILSEESFLIQCVRYFLCEFKRLPTMCHFIILLIGPNLSLLFILECHPSCEPHLTAIGTYPPRPTVAENLLRVTFESWLPWPALAEMLNLLRWNQNGLFFPGHLYYPSASSSSRSSLSPLYGLLPLRSIAFLISHWAYSDRMTLYLLLRTRQLNSALNHGQTSLSLTRISSSSSSDACARAQETKEEKTIARAQYHQKRGRITA